jgi:hypothetical protein
MATEIFVKVERRKAPSLLLTIGGVSEQAEGMGTVGEIPILPSAFVVTKTFEGLITDEFRLKDSELLCR